MHRRDLMGTALAFGAMQAAQRPRTFERFESCADTGIVDWTPDVLHPVSYGFTDFDAGEAGAPMPLRVSYPSYLAPREGAGNSAPLLKMCDVRWPLVLLLHGGPPCQRVGEVPGYNRRWSRFASVLAKSGYVVVIPNRDAALPTSSAIAEVLRLIDWVRGVQVDSHRPGAATARALGPLQTRRWENADWVHPRALAIAGHSWGALLAAYVARVRPTSSFVSLDAGFTELPLPDPAPLLQSIPGAKFFMWERNGQARLDGPNGGTFGVIPAPKYAAIYTGEHFDFIRTGCNEIEGNCTPHIRALAPDLVALFIARNTRVGASSAGVPVGLLPPGVPLSDKQELFARNHLHSLTQSGCPVALQWNTPEGSGSRTQGG